MNTGNKVSTAIESTPAMLSLSSIRGDLWHCFEDFIQLLPYEDTSLQYEVGDFLEHIDWSVSLHILNYDY
jgi:hypothetical protein